MRLVLLTFLGFFTCTFMLAQTTITGNVSDIDTKEPMPGASIRVQGTTSGASSEFDGSFTLITNAVLPVKLEVTMIGYDKEIVEVKNNAPVTIVMHESHSALDEIVVSASRTPERIFESPVTVERMSLREIQNTASPDFYDGLENLKGVDINVNSLTFKAINTRGFATFANTRFMQLVDGMDNSAPALNFPLGNLLGMNELDIYSVELLPGAASALYGANAFNGILFMTSKNPFEFPGISAYLKPGITVQDAAGTNFLLDVGVRAAGKFSDKFAGKLNISYLKGTDWAADNYEDKLFRDLTRNDPDYDGTNVYGDEVSTNIKAASGGLGIIPNVNVSRTGYNEMDLTDYTAQSIKADAGLYWRPKGDDLEVSFIAKYGYGTTIYQGTNRYNISNFDLQQFKLEIRNNNFFVRGYMTEDDAGDSYDMVFTGININRKWKSDKQWFGEYINTYAGATLGGATDDQAHAAARAAADTGRWLPDSQEFKDAFKEVTSDSNLSTGSKFVDNSRIYHADANYNFTHLWDWAQIQAGGSYRTYELNSSGTIYTDYDGPIDYSEYGVYTQIQKNLLAEDRLKVTASLRYDKSELFDGFFSPRLSLAYTAGAMKEHNIRASVQTGFRNPTTQDLFIGLDAGRAVLVGSAEDNLDRDVRTYSVSQNAQNAGIPATVEVVGRAAYENAFSISSVQSGAPAAADIEIVKPEEVTSYEIGYRGKAGNFIIDLLGYHNKYKDFISGENVLVPFYGVVGDNSLSLFALQNGDYKAYSTYTNSDADVKSYGASIGVSTRVFGNYDLQANYTYAKEDFDKENNPDFRTNFNTPEHRLKATFGNANVYENFGFNVAWRWSDDFFWEATFGDGPVESYHTFDAQVSYRMENFLNSMVKVGAANLFADEYTTAFGTGYVGAQYYVSWVINNF